MAAVGPFGLGPMELVVILLVLVMLFGATRLADLGGSLGKGIKEFRKAVKEEDEEGGNAESAPASTDTQAQAQATAFNGADGHQETVQAVKCGTCGGLNAVGAKFCSQCGNTIAAPVS
jgi:sec-independent protein translocase protein TatA